MSKQDTTAYQVVSQHKVQEDRLQPTVIAGSWKEVSLQEIATLQRGCDLPVVQRKQGPYPVIGSNGIVGYHKDFMAKGPGVLIGRSGSVGKVTWAENNYWPLNTSLWVKDFHSNDPKFVFFLLNYLDLGKYTEGVSVPSLNRNIIHPLRIKVPPLPEQRAIAHALQTVQNAIRARRSEIELERECKAALMQRLFTRGIRNEPTKMSEVGEIPESWEVVRLGEIASIASGGTPDRAKPEYWNGDIPWVKTGEINYDVITKVEEKITKEGLEYSSAKVIPAGTLLMAMYGQGITRGRVAILGIDAAINQACAAIFIRDTILTEFLFHFFAYIYESIRELGHGANQKNLNSALVKSINIPLPHNKGEQKEIASVLQACDSKISTLEKELSLHEELFRALLDELMTGRLSALPLVE